MNVDALIEWTLERAIAEVSGENGPPKLNAALRHAVFPGGARVRPQLCLAVAHACGGDDLQPAAGAGAAIELLHCASLVHDDLPCFDDAEIRRGKPSVHVAFGEPLAVLAGDALIITAFDTLARECVNAAERLPGLLRVVTEAVGAPNGIVAGQAWESEEAIDLSAYHRAKTGALFVAAASAGAVSAGADSADWRNLGDRLGEAYQIADDLRDFVMDAEELGKPAGQDSLHDRPNAVTSLGLAGAVDQLKELIRDAAESVPACNGAGALKQLVYAQADRLMPKSLAAGVS